jgi:O-antigen ligase
MALSLIFFFISITGIFLSEVFNKYGRLELGFFLVTLTPFLFFLLSKIEKKKIIVPTKESIFYLIFILFSTVSTVSAIDKEIATQSLLIYASGYSFFLFAFNFKESLGKYFQWFLIIISIFSSLLFLINKIHPLSLFQEGASLFYNYDHNQLGNLLVLGLILIFPNPLFLIFFVFIILSYSRTAYVSLSLVLSLKALNNRRDKKIVYLVGITVLTSIFFLILTTKNFYLTKNKQLFGGRNIYFSYALSSIKEKPWFGVGPANFVYAVAKRQVNFGENTTTAHNIFFDVLAENGILSGVFFVFFVLSILKRQKNQVYFLIFLALSLMFMSDFSYRYNIFLILWFILAGIISKPKKTIELDPFLPIFLIFILVQIIILSNILLNLGFGEQSLLINPLQRVAYEIEIEKNIEKGNKQRAKYYLQKYNQIFGLSYQTVLRNIKYYQDLNEKNKIITEYKKLIFMRPFIFNSINNDMLGSFISFYGEDNGWQEFGKILFKIKAEHYFNNRPDDIHEQINVFCNEKQRPC